MGIQLNRFQIQRSVELIQEDVESGGNPRANSVVSLWKSLAYTVYRHRDLQCGDIPFIHLSEGVWEVWQNQPSKALDFITLTARKLNFNVKVTERLDHEQCLARATIFVSNSLPIRPRAYSGKAVGEKLEIARFNAILLAFSTALKSEQF